MASNLSSATLHSKYFGLLWVKQFFFIFFFPPFFLSYEQLQNYSQNMNKNRVYNLQ